MKIFDGGVTSAKGFFAEGAHIGVKKEHKDLALIKSCVKAVAAGTFTQNKVKAAPVLWDEKNYKNDIYGIAIVSGNANACTGSRGINDNYIMAAAYAEALNVLPENILICATGVIGVPLPIEKVVKGIRQVEPKETREGGANAAKAILTTDTFVKEAAVQTEIGGKTVTIGGMAKGSGMIHPNMATLLAFITTDASITREMLSLALSESVSKSYNMISVDGDTSTNDTVLTLANGESECPLIRRKNEDFEKFCKALDYINIKLAKDIAKDGEGASKFIEVSVNGASTENDARRICKTVVSSSLVKTAIFGEDANWGRVLAAMGRSGANFKEEDVSLGFSSAAGSIALMDKGVPITFDEAEAKNVLKEKEIKISIKMEKGSKSATAWGCDLTYEYVKINGEYRT